MYMGMEVQFDFAVHPVDEFTRRLCQQVEANIESGMREERVQRKRRELRERIKVQIVTSPYTMTPTSSVIDSHRRDSMALPQERGSFTPFQKTPFRNAVAEPDRRNDSLFKPYSYNNFGSVSGKPHTGSSSSTETPRYREMKLSSASVTDQPTAVTESFSSHSPFSVVCSPPIQSLSPTMCSPTKGSFGLKDYEEDEGSTASTLQTNNEDAFIKTRPPRQKSKEKTRESCKEQKGIGMGCVQEEFFWIVDYRGTEKIFDSDAFTFAGTRFRLTFGPNTSTTPRISNGYSLLLALAQSHGGAYVSCEFSVHGLLRPTFCRKCSKNLHFTAKSSVYRGYKHFMGPELLSYLENGTFTFSIVMKTYLGPNRELLGLPDMSPGTVPGAADINDNDSEMASKSEAGVEEECRMDAIYPLQSDDYYFRAGGHDLTDQYRYSASSQSQRGREKNRLLDRPLTSPLNRSSIGSPLSMNKVSRANE